MPSPVVTPKALATIASEEARVKTKFKNLLHQYKVEAFKSSHNNEQIEEHSQEIGKFTEDVLNRKRDNQNKAHYNSTKW